MKIKTINRIKSNELMKDWINNYPKLPSLDNDYVIIRKNIVELYEEAVEYSEMVSSNRKDYALDSRMGILLYEYLWTIPEFNLRTAANDDFWRYLSLQVVPQVVGERWGNDNESHYWKRATRIWLRCIWWYTHLSWQGNRETTQRVLEAPCFTTDSILNLVERTGRKGTFVEVYRFIIYYYSKVPLVEIAEYNKKMANKNDDLFRAIMRLNTAKSVVIDPALYLGGEKEYVRSLFDDLGIKI